MGTPVPESGLSRAFEARRGRLLDLLEAGGWEQDPSGLHDVRVAARRLQAVLGTPKRRLRRLIRLLALPRDLDVHLERLATLRATAEAPAVGATAEHLLEVLTRRRARALGAMHRGLLRLGMAAWLKRMVPPGAGIDEPPAFPSWLEGEAPSPEQLHRLRIRVKRRRYALEALAELGAQAPELERRKDLQAALGDHHETHLLGRFLERRARKLAGRGRTLLEAGVRTLAADVEALRRERYAIALDALAACGRAPRTAEEAGGTP